MKVKSKREYKKKKRRVGRGPGSGRGKTSGRGHKGQLSRAGGGKGPGFEGGQMTYVRRLPKRGFSNAQFKKDVSIINLRTLSQLDEKEITPDVLKEKGVVDKKAHMVKVLGTGTVEKAYTVHANSFSKKAQDKIEAAGGKTVVMSVK